MAKKEATMSGEQVTFTVRKRISVESIEGGLYSVAYTEDNGDEIRKAATTVSALLALITEALDIEKKARKPRQKKA